MIFFNIIAASGVTPSNAKDNIIFYIGGQSNAVGTGTGAPPIVYRDAIIGARIDINGTFQTLDFGINNKGASSSDHGIELSFSKDYVAATNRDLYLAKEAVGGSAIEEIVDEQDWNINSNELINDLDTAIARLKIQYDQTVKPKFVFYWNQGERDARLSKGNTYYTNLKNILDRVNAVIPIDLAVITKLRNDLGTNYPDEQIVRDAHAQLSMDISYVENLDMMNYTLGGDGLHFTSDAQIQMGKDILTFCETKFNL